MSAPFVRSRRQLDRARGVGKPSDVTIYLGGSNLDAAAKVHSSKARRVGDTNAVGS